MAVIYKMCVVSVDTETHEQKEVVNEDLSGFVVLGECAGKDEGKMTEIWIHESISGLANKICQAKKVKQAAQLALTLEKMFGYDEFEDLLQSSIEGGLQ